MEVELKFELAQGELERLRAHPVLGPLTTGKPRTRIMHSIYYDTPDDALFATHTWLRVRKSGKRWVQTVKRGSGISGGLSNPMELETEVRGSLPEMDAIAARTVAKDIAEPIGDQPLVARFETRLRRTTRMLAMEEGDIELALNAGRLVFSTLSKAARGCRMLSCSAAIRHSR